MRPDPRANIPAEYKPADWLINAPNRPPDDTKFITHRAYLYAAIGAVLTQWELLETVLAIEFQRLLGTAKNSALRAYGSVLAHGTRCDMLLAAAEVELTGDELATFQTCIADVRRLSGVRNMIAHGTVVHRDEDAWIVDDPRLEPTGPFALSPAPYNSKKFNLAKGGPSYLYSVLAVEEVGREIQKAISRVGALNPATGYQAHWRFRIG